jgi:mRNA interferase RelE/StbE
VSRRIVYSASAVKDLRRLDKPTAKRIMDKVDRLAAGDEIALTALKYIPVDLGPLYKYRVGDYRVLFRLEGGDINVDVIAHRSDFYKILRRR